MIRNLQVLLYISNGNFTVVIYTFVFVERGQWYGIYNKAKYKSNYRYVRET